MTSIAYGRKGDYIEKTYRDSSRIRLQPSKIEIESIFTELDNVEIQGKVITVIRKFP
ncbi:hypothetical protein ACFLT8_00580 [Chloroflexota bacterium]